MTSYEILIAKWRKDWQTKSKHLSIVGCGSVEEAISIAVDKAHAPSVLRALETNGISTKEPRKKVKGYLVKEIAKMLEKKSFIFDEYDALAETVCTKIRDIYHDAGISDYSFGNAQKLFNMAIKYVLSADNIDPNLPIFKVAHIPVDRVIMNITKKKLGVRRMSDSWSKTDDFNEILDYQKRYRAALPEGYTPLAWECENWKS